MSAALRYNRRMLSVSRRLVSLLTLTLVLGLGCGKKAEEEGEGKADPNEVAKKDDKAPPTKQPPESAPAEGVADGAGEGGGEEDKSCDPTEKGECLEGETCVGKQGCDAVWECDAKVVCKKDIREYCGCDGKTFEAEYGNCPGKKYQYPGPCK